MKLHMLKRDAVTKTQSAENFTALSRESMKQVVGGNDAYLGFAAYAEAGAYFNAYNQ